MARSILVVGIDEESDKITLCSLLFLTGFIHRTGEGNVCLVVSEILHYIRD